MLLFKKKSVPPSLGVFDGKLTISGLYCGCLNKEQNNLNFFLSVAKRDKKKKTIIILDRYRLI